MLAEADVNYVCTSLNSKAAFIASNNEAEHFKDM